MNSNALIVRVSQPTRVIRSNGTPAQVRVPVTATRVVRTGVPGPVGGVGPPGPSAGGAVYVAAHPISGHRLVSVRGGIARYPDLTQPADAYSLAGVTTGASETGAAVVVEASGLLEESGWAWTPGALVYAGNAGALTQTPPVSGWLRIVGVAQTPTSLFVALREPIMQEDN